MGQFLRMSLAAILVTPVLLLLLTFCAALADFAYSRIVPEQIEEDELWDPDPFYSGDSGQKDTPTG
jgi:hypothetical protein